MLSTVCWVRSTVLMKITIAFWRRAILCLVQCQTVHTRPAWRTWQQQLLVFYSPTTIPQETLSCWKKFGPVGTKWMSKSKLQRIFGSLFDLLPPDLLRFGPKTSCSWPCLPVFTLWQATSRLPVFRLPATEHLAGVPASIPPPEYSRWHKCSPVGWFWTFWAGLFSMASQQDFHGFQERQGFAHIGKNKWIKQLA